MPCKVEASALRFVISPLFGGFAADLIHHIPDRRQARLDRQRQWTRRQVGQALAAVAGAGLPCRAAAGAPADAPWLTLPPTPPLPTPARSGVAAVNGTRIFFAQFGAGEPVLLLHGGMANSSYWGHQIPELARHFSVTAMDTRGHGRSPVTSAAFEYRLFAEDVTALLDHLGIPRVSLVGWSDGAVTGLELAMTRPEKVTRLFAFGANSTLDGLKPNGARSPVFVTYAQRCRAEYRQLSPRPEKWPQLIDGLRAMWRSQPSFSNEKLASIRAPTAVSDGEYDEIIKREHSEAMARHIPAARLVMLPRVSHFAMLQNPAQFNAALLDFLKG
jgi:pimeloyl-ACP methyl ester carboxylesterase